MILDIAAHAHGEIRAFVFDMDGVLIDSHPAHFAAWKKFFRTLSINVREQDLAFILEGRTRAEILRHFIGERTDSEIAEYGRRKDEIFRAMEPDIRPFPGIMSFLVELERF